MKIYVSSTFVDLKAHRDAALKVLRQLGPITTFDGPADGQTDLVQLVKVVDKSALEAQLARSYLDDLLRRSGVRV
jgi:hypothetical protein